MIKRHLEVSAAVFFRIFALCTGSPQLNCIKFLSKLICDAFSQVNLLDKSILGHAFCAIKPINCTNSSSESSELVSITPADIM